MKVAFDVNVKELREQIGEDAFAYWMEQDSYGPVLGLVDGAAMHADGVTLVLIFEVDDEADLASLASEFEVFQAENVAGAVESVDQEPEIAEAVARVIAGAGDGKS